MIYRAVQPLAGLPANARKRTVEHGVVQLLPFGTVEILDKVLNLDAFEKYVQDRTKDPLTDELSLGYSFLVALAFERLIDAVLLDPSMFGLRWNELVHRVHYRDVPFSEFPDKSNIGKVVRSLTTEYREFLSVRTFPEMKDKANKVRVGVLPPLVRWGRSTRFFQSPGSTKMDTEQVRKELAILFLLNFVQDLPYVIVAYNNTFQRGRWFEPQFQPLRTEISAQKFFEGFKLGAAYLWHSIVGEEVEGQFPDKILSAKDWEEYYNVHPIIRRVLADESWEHIETVASVEVSRSPAFQGLKRERSSKVEKDYLDRLDEIFRMYDVRLVGETFTARIASNFLAYLIGALTYYSDKVRVIRFVHPDSPGQNRYSYAVFSWVPVQMGDQSEWLLFFNFCDDYSPRGLSAFVPIESFLRKHQARLEVLTFRFTPLQLLNHALTRPDWSESVMSPLTREHNNLGTVAGLRVILAADRQDKGFARGIILEQLVMLMVAKLGYQARWRVETLGREMDVLALKTSDSGKPLEILIVECSTQYLPTDLKELEEKLELAKSNIDKLLERFGVKASKPPNVKGWLVTTDRNYPDGVAKGEPISIISWESLKSRLKKEHVVLPVGLDELLTKEEAPARYILDPDSVISGVSPPPTEDGSPPKGTVMMHDGLLLPRNWSEILSGNAGYLKRKARRRTKT